VELDKEKIHYFQKNRDQFLMVDHVTDLKTGSYAKGYKKLNKDLWFFKVHWPGDPNMPASLQLESLTQICALPILSMNENIGKFMYVVSASNLKFKKKITPEYQKFELDTKILSYKRGLAVCSGSGFVNGELACSADFTLVLEGEIDKFKVNK
jgi:3-hydroxyacyl-[acyl-carrier-protein] dehydratase